MLLLASPERVSAKSNFSIPLARGFSYAFARDQGLVRQNQQKMWGQCSESPRLISVLVRSGAVRKSTVDSRRSWDVGTIFPGSGHELPNRRTAHDGSTGHRQSMIRPLRLPCKRRFKKGKLHLGITSTSQQSSPSTASDLTPTPHRLTQHCTAQVTARTDEKNILFAGYLLTYTPPDLTKWDKLRGKRE